MPEESDTDLFSTALALPAGERSRLARALLRSLDEGAEPDAAAAWLTEIKRRAREVDDGAADLQDWSSVRTGLEDRWRKRQP